MKKIAFAAAALATVAAMPAAAQQVTGTVNITGSVAPKCLVVPSNGGTFGTTVALGELAQSNGTMRTDLAASFNAASGLSARVVCTSAAPTISVDANPLATAAPADTGYDNSIDFTASVAVTTVGTSPAPFTNDTAAAALSATAIGGRLANNGSDNIVITASNFRTGTVNDLLVASPTYSGSIAVVIAPGA